MEHSIEHIMEHKMKHSMEHSMEHSMKHSMEHSMEHICMFRWLSRHIEGFTLNCDLRLLAFWSTTTGRN